MTSSEAINEAYIKANIFLNSNKEKLCLLAGALSAIFIVFSLFDVSVLVGFLTFLASIFGYLYLRLQKLRKEGIINKVSPKTKHVLLNRSILDIYRDLIYFPYVTRIIGAFVKGAISKPAPEQLPRLFEDLPQNVRDAINTKGLLHLAPQKVQKLILENQEQQSENNGESNQIGVNNAQKIKIVKQISDKWDNLQKYESQHEVKVHERTFGKQMLLNVNDKIRWRHVAGLAAIVVYGLMKTRSKKMAKIFLYNGSFAGVLLLLMLVLVKLKKPSYPSRQLPIQNQ